MNIRKNKRLIMTVVQVIMTVLHKRRNVTDETSVWDHGKSYNKHKQVASYYNVTLENGNTVGRNWYHIHEAPSTMQSKSTTSHM